MNTENHQFLRKLVVRLGLITVLLLAVLLISPIMLGGGKEVKLKSAALLTGQVAQALDRVHGGNLQTPGKDFQLQDVTYFQDKQWVYVHIKPTDTHAQDSFAVLHKKNGIYTVVVGPGTEFDSNTTNGLPDEVGLFLVHKGMVYDTTN